MKRLCIITALAAESRALLDTLKLRQINARHLRLYASEQYLLLECGIGKLNAAASTGAVLQAHPDIAAVVNLGIAGGCHAYGQSVVAHQVRDHATGAQWFPHLPDNSAFRSLPSSCVSTVDVPDTQYRETELFDMEAAGVFSAASRCLSTSQIHSVKVISDNPEHCVKDINKRSVIELMTNAIPTITPLLDVLRLQFADHEPTHISCSSQFIEQILQTVHHTVNDELLLRKMVQQHITLTGELPEIDAQTNTAAQIRHALQSMMATTPFLYR